MPDNLFVYGTLMRGFDNPMARLLAERAEFLGAAAVAGRLYLVAHYPGFVLSDDASERVSGELFRLPESDDLLRQLDDYEGCGPNDQLPTAYVRHDLPVTLGDGAQTQAFVYIYNRPVAGLMRLVSGRFPRPA